MASTYSALKIELMGTGDQSGTWGTTTNTNLGTAIEEAITGSADVTFASADVTLTLTNSNSSQTARNLRLNLIGTVAAVQNLIVPAIEKQYIINNTLGFAITVKNSTGTGVAVPAGKSMILFNTGSNVLNAIDYVAGVATSGANSDITSLSGLTTPLSVGQGGSGVASTTAYGILAGGTTSTGAFQNAGVGTSGQVLTSNGAGALPTFQTVSTPTPAFPSGTRMSFQQTAAPTGWTKDTTAALNNTAMRIVTGSVVNGGSVAFTTAFASQTPTGSVSVTSVTGTAGATTLTTPQIPSHTHPVTNGLNSPFTAPNKITAGLTANSTPVTVTTNSTGGDGSHDHPFSFSSGDASFTGDAINLAVKYYDFIIASKD
jgi:hypothetical protein